MLCWVIPAESIDSWDCFLLRTTKRVSNLGTPQKPLGFKFGNSRCSYIFPWFSHDFPINFPWISHVFPYFPRFSQWHLPPLPSGGSIPLCGPWTASSWVNGLGITGEWIGSGKSPKKSYYYNTIIVLYYYVTIVLYSTISKILLL